MPSRWIRIVVCASLLSGCLHPGSQICRDGDVCPPGLQCLDTGNTTVDSRICAAGTCGNVRLDPGEVCDDGNNRSGDGCPADCSQPCGDGVLDPDEACDDGNTVDGDGCSADCMSGDGIFLVTPSVVSFAATEGDPLPARVTVTVRLLHRDDKVDASYPPEVSNPTWLSMLQGLTRQNTAELWLRVTDTSVVGQWSTTLRLTISGPSSPTPRSFDLPVTYRVEPAGLAIQAVPATLDFTAVRGDMLFQSRTVTVTFNGDDVARVSAPVWLTVFPPQAPMVSPAPFVIRINSNAFPDGTVRSGEIVFVTRRGTAERRTSVHVDYTIAPELAIAVAPSLLRFTAIHGGALPPSQTIDVTFTGARISCIDAPSWVTVTRPPDPTTSPARFIVSGATTSLAAGTVQSGRIVFQTTSSVWPKAADVQVDYDVRHRPEVQFVAPYLGVPGRAGRLYVRGRGFHAYNRSVTVRIGDLELGPVNPDNDTLITLSYAQMPEGRYPVTLLDPTAIAPRAPESVIAARPAYAYQAIDAPGDRVRIVYDPERRAIYGTDPQNQRIDHFVYSGGTWSMLSPHAIPQVADIAMAPDGRSLIVVDRTKINEVSLIDTVFAPVVRATFSDSSCSPLGRAAVANNGKLYVPDRGGGSFCPSHVYDMVDHSLVHEGPSRVDAVAASGDGSRIYVHTANSSSLDFKIYNALSNTFSYMSSGVSGVFAISVSDDASRLILNDTAVYSRSLRLVGNVPQRGRFATLVSRDASRAFVYAQTDQQARLEVYDLGGPLQPGGMYPLITTIMISDRANEPNHFAMAMTSTPDDSVVFISGTDRLLVVPVN